MVGDCLRLIFQTALSWSLNPVERSSLEPEGIVVVFEGLVSWARRLRVTGVHKV